MNKETAKERTKRLKGKSMFYIIKESHIKEGQEMKENKKQWVNIEEFIEELERRIESDCDISKYPNRIYCEFDNGREYRNIWILRSLFGFNIPFLLINKKKEVKND